MDEIIERRFHPALLASISSGPPPSSSRVSLPPSHPAIQATCLTQHHFNWSPILCCLAPLLCPTKWVLHKLVIAMWQLLSCGHIAAITAFLFFLLCYCLYAALRPLRCIVAIKLNCLELNGRGQHLCFGGAVCIIDCIN